MDARYEDGVWRRASFFWLEKTLALARSDLSSYEVEESRRAEARLNLAHLGSLADTLDGLDAGMADLRLQLAQRDERIRQLNQIISSRQLASDAPAAEAPSRLASTGSQTAEPAPPERRSRLADSGTTLHEFGPGEPVATVAEPRVSAQLANLGTTVHDFSSAEPAAAAPLPAAVEAAGLRARVALLEEQLERAQAERAHANEALSKLLVLSHSLSAAVEQHEALRAAPHSGGAAGAAREPTALRDAGQDEAADVACASPALAREPPAHPAQPPDAADSTASVEEAVRASGTDTLHTRAPASPRERSERAARARVEQLHFERIVRTQSAARVMEADRRWRDAHARAQSLALQLRDERIAAKAKELEAAALAEPPPKPGQRSARSPLPAARRSASKATMPRAPKPSTLPPPPAAAPAPIVAAAGLFYTYPPVPMGPSTMTMPYYDGPRAPAAILLLPSGVR
jgi:hypothetical protein